MRAITTLTVTLTLILHLSPFTLTSPPHPHPGDLDVLVKEDGTDLLTLHTYDGTSGKFTLAKDLTSELHYTPYFDGRPIKVGDVNSDGVLDIVLTNGTGVSVYLCADATTFDYELRSSIGSGRVQVFELADFSDDGHCALNLPILRRRMHQHMR